MRQVVTHVTGDSRKHDGPLKCSYIKQRGFLSSEIMIKPLYYIEKMQLYNNVQPSTMQPSSGMGRSHRSIVFGGVIQSVNVGHSLELIAKAPLQEHTNMHTYTISMRF